LFIIPDKLPANFSAALQLEEDKKRPKFDPSELADSSPQPNLAVAQALPKKEDLVKIYTYFCVVYANQYKTVYLGCFCKNVTRFLFDCCL